MRNPSFLKLVFVVGLMSFVLPVTTSARWISVDPVASKYPSWSPYVYCADNPLKYTDPDGAALRLPERPISENETAVESFILDVAWGIVTDPIPSTGTVTGVGRGLAKASAKTGAKAANKAATSTKVAQKGIYEFTATSGKKYVGASKQVPERLKQHVRSGKATPEEAVNAKFTNVSGNKTALEIAEQNRINELGGVNNLENVRNPIGKRRQHLWEDQKPKD